MNSRDLKRFEDLDKILLEYANEEGLETREITWEFSPPGRMWEIASTGLPTNYSFWYHGRRFDEQKHQYEMGGGEIFEAVFNYDQPYALMARTNPLPLNVMVAAHVRGHVDFNLRNTFMRRSRERVDMAHLAREAASRIDEYYREYGQEDVEKVIEAGHAVSVCMNPDPHFEFEPEENVRKRLIDVEKEKIKKTKEDPYIGESRKEERVKLLKNRIADIKKQTPPRAEYDVLGYLLRHHSKDHAPYVLDILNVVYEQRRYLAPIGRCQILNEGWASYWHEKFTRRLFSEGRIDDKEYGVMSRYHSGVLTNTSGKQVGLQFNPYFIGKALWDDICDRWDRGQYGVEYLGCRDPLKRSTQQREGHEGEGKKKIFELSATHDDRMAVSDPEIFTNEFIRHNKLFVWAAGKDLLGNDIVKVVEDDPTVIRYFLTQERTNYGRPLIAVIDGDYQGRGELYLHHDFFGQELDPQHEHSVLEYVYFIYGKPVHLETVEVTERDERGTPVKVVDLVHSYDGAKHHIEKEKERIFYPVM